MNYSEIFDSYKVFIIYDIYWYFLILVLRFIGVIFNKIFGKFNWIINIDDKRYFNLVFK